MGTVDGSVDDESNLVAYKMVREAGLNTYLPSDGDIASGGVDFFIAGIERTVNSNNKNRELFSAINRLESSNRKLKMAMIAYMIGVVVGFAL